MAAVGGAASRCLSLGAGRPQGSRPHWRQALLGTSSRQPAGRGPRQPVPGRGPVGRGLSAKVAVGGGGDAVVDEDSQLAENLRLIPLVAGGSGIVGTLANRLLSGIAPVVDASSSQSRTDVLVIILSASLLLTGLQWLSLKPKPPVKAELDGDEVEFLAEGLPEAAASEMKWIYSALSTATTGRALVVIYGGKCVCHLGTAKKRIEVGNAMPGVIGSAVMGTGKGNYLANLVLFPGRAEFLDYLPSNTQGVILQALGKNGLMIVASDTPRSFGSIDKAWITSLAEKLEVTLSESMQNS